MSMSGAEYLRRIKEQVDEVDPSQVRELAHEGAAIIDVRETEEWDVGHLPGARHVPARLPGVAHRRRRPRPLRST